MREEFEVWAKSKYMPLRRDSSDEYWVETTQSAWGGWKASREALKIKLPRVIFWGRLEVLEGYDLDEVQEALKAAGVHWE